MIRLQILSDGNIRNIIRDIEDAQKIEGGLGDFCDEKIWLETLEKLKEQENNDK